MNSHSQTSTPDDIAAAVGEDLRREYGPSIEACRIGEAMTGGFDNILVRLEISGNDRPSDWPTSVVARVFPRHGQHAKAAREQAVQEYARKNAFPAARVLSSGSVGANSYLLIEFINAPAAVEHFLKPWRVSRTMTVIARLQAQLHSLPTSSWPSDGPVRTVDRWMSEMRTSAADLPTTDFDAQLSWLEANKAEADCDDLRVCRRSMCFCRGMARPR